MWLRESAKDLKNTLIAWKSIAGASAAGNITITSDPERVEPHEMELILV
jgi:uncharacterized membrane protein